MEAGGLWVIMCHYKFSSCYKCAALVGWVDMGGAPLPVWGAGCLWELSVPHQLCYWQKMSLRRAENCNPGLASCGENHRRVQQT